jgi:hypothetical protein
MAVREGTRASKEFMCVSLAPDFCKSPNIVVPYSIVSKFDCAVNFSTNVRFRKQWVFRHNSRLSTVLGDEAGVGGGVLSGVNKGFCRPIDGTSSKTVRANNAFVDYHEGTYMFMNCAGPDGQFNTIGRVVFLGNMLPGPVAPGGKVPKSCVEGSSSLLADIESQFGDLNDLIGKAKQLYALAQTDWSNPAAVLGAMGGLAGIAGLQDVADLAKKGKELYELGKKVVNTDWSDPMQALSAIAGVANVAGMQDIAKVAGMANTIGNAIKTDWSDPRAALASATAIMKNTGLNQMAAEMASNAILDSNIPVSQTGTAPPLFPKPGSAGKDAGPPIPPSTKDQTRAPITPERYNEIKATNSVAAARYDALSEDEKNQAFVEYPNGSADPSQVAVYIPGQGFSTTPAEQDALPNVSQFIPKGIREIFVASAADAKEGNFLGIKEKEGNVYLFGGLLELGSPEMPGAGTGWTWFVPDRILNMDFAPYFDYHDRNYYHNPKLADIGTVLAHELNAFKAGATSNPLQLPLQMVYSAFTTGVGLGSIALNEFNQAILGSSGEEKAPSPGGLQIDSFSSIGDFFSNGFGSGGIDPKSMVDFFGPGGCMPDSVPTLPGQTVPGGPSGPGAGTKPATGKAGAPEGDASGAGKDGVLITTKAGNPAAAAAAIEKKAKAESKKALEKSQAEEKAKQERAAKEKARKEKPDAPKPEPSKPESALPEASKTEAVGGASAAKNDPLASSNGNDGVFVEGDWHKRLVVVKDGKVTTFEGHPNSVNVFDAELIVREHHRRPVGILDGSERILPPPGVSDEEFRNNVLAAGRNAVFNSGTSRYSLLGGAGAAEGSMNSNRLVHEVLADAGFKGNVPTLLAPGLNPSPVRPTDAEYQSRGMVPPKPGPIPE